MSENKRTGAQKVSYSADLAVTPYPRDNNTIAAKEAYLKEIIGAFPVMFDFNEFLGLIDTERRTFFTTCQLAVRSGRARMFMTDW